MGNLKIYGIQDGDYHPEVDHRVMALLVLMTKFKASYPKPGSISCASKKCNNKR